MMIYKRGDVVLVRFPNSDLLTYKKRPALVIQDETIETGLPQRLVAMITSNLGRTGEMRVLIQQASLAGREMGLLTDSVVMADNLATVHEREIDKLLGHCWQMSAIDAALRKALRLWFLNFQAGTKTMAGPWC